MNLILEFNLINSKSMFYFIIFIFVVLDEDFIRLLLLIFKQFYKPEIYTLNGN